MKTVTQVMDWYNKQQSDTYDYIVIADPLRGPYATLTYYNVTDVVKTNGILSFYGKREYEKTIGGMTRFVRINQGKIIRSEV